MPPRTAKHDPYRCREHLVRRVALRAVWMFLCASQLLCVGWAQTHERKADWSFRPALPSLPPVRPFRLPLTAPEPSALGNLPGLGGSVLHTPPTPSIGSQFVGGSLVYAPSAELVPAVYIEGRGYVPLGDPSIRPYISEESAAHPEYNPYVAMIPNSVLDGSSVSAAVIMVKPTGHTLSFGPADDRAEPIIISANSGWSKTVGEHDVLFLDGDCCVRQGRNTAQGPHAVIWIERNDGLRKVHVYMESDVDEVPLHVEFDPERVNARLSDKKWFGRFSTTSQINTLIVRRALPPPDDPVIYQRGQRMMSPEGSAIQQVQFVQGAAPDKKTASGVPSVKRIRFSSRNDLLWDGFFERFPDDPSQGVSFINKGGINIIIEGADHALLLGNVIDISADRGVAWGPNILNGGEEGRDDYEVYLEGNIIFRDGERQIEAQRMYYDAKNGLAYILDAKLTTPIIGVPGISGSIRLQAETLQKIGEGLFTAKNGLASTSLLGEPSYSLHAKTMKYDDSAHRQFLVAENNYVAFGKVPVLYWPWMAADLKDPTFYLRNVAYGTSTHNGQSVRTNWNPFQLLNIRNRPTWLNADLEVQWIENRGIGHGLDLDYSPPGSVGGIVRFWGISDSGTDRLGGPRQSVAFPHHYRYRVFWNHVQEIPSFWKPIPSPWSLTAKVGKTSDRNFINSYFPNEWHEDENRTTSLELKTLCGNSSMSLFTEYALDDCYSNANWLPRLQHTWLGEPLLGDRLTWYEHTRVGFANFRTATPPNSTEWTYTRFLPWELRPGSLNQPGDAETIDTWGEVFSTRHEFDLPFNLGPVRCVPFVLGDYSHWGKDRDDKSVDRLYGLAGVRLNLPFWKVFPNHSSRTWYVNGLAHKVDFDTEFSYARSNRSMKNLVLYDSLDNWATEDARRRYWQGTYHLSGFVADPACPVRFDPRYYALRSGMGGRVTASNMEIADDMMLTRFGMTHRFQTKRGPVGKRRIIDWITMSAHVNYYPEAKDYIDESVGLIDYDFLWNIGDRFAVFSSGIYDVFDYGQNVTRIGGTWQRPERGNFTLAVDQLHGLFKQTVLKLHTGYNLNEKYSVAYLTSYDMSDNWRNLGHNIMFVRTGESFRLLIGATYRESTDEWGFSFGIEPVFMRGIAKKMMRAADSTVSTTR